jgi:hypothetical protein
MQDDDRHKAQPTAGAAPDLPTQEPDTTEGGEGMPNDPAIAQPAGSKPRRKTLSTILTEIAADSSRDRVSIGDLLRTMHGRAIAALMLIFAFPNVLPSPPGTSGLLGLPLVYLTSQMMLGRLPWLPAFIANRSMARSDFEGLVARVAPVLARAERLLRPRLPFLVTTGAERVIGGLCLLLSIIVLLPIPFGNSLPALAVCIFALGVLERDGVWILTGLVVSVLAVGVVASVLYALAKAAIFLIANAFA